MKGKYLLAFIFLMAAGCQKELAGLSSGMQGNWELVSTESAWSGHHDYAPGNGNTYSFNGNTYSRRIIIGDSTYLYSGTFTIYQDKPCDFADEQTLIRFDEAEMPSSFSMSGDKLTIGTTECIADGGSSTYRKIQ